MRPLLSGHATYHMIRSFPSNVLWFDLVAAIQTGRSWMVILQHPELSAILCDRTRPQNRLLKSGKNGSRPGSTGLPASRAILALPLVGVQLCKHLSEHSSPELLYPIGFVSLHVSAHIPSTITPSGWRFAG